jgi:hypothetical protein
MRAIMAYFWRVVYWLRPVTEKTSRTAYVKAACRMNGIKVVNHKVVKPAAVDYHGLGWVGVTEHKICCEAACNFVYAPDHTGRCPKCGSEGIWISKTAIGINRAEDRAGVKGLAKELTSRYWFNQYADEGMNEVLRQAGFRLPGDLSAEEIYKNRKGGRK